MTAPKPQRGGARPGAGRKPGSGTKPDGEKRRNRIIVLATDGEHARLTARAKGQPVSVYLRERGLK